GNGIEVAWVEGVVNFPAESMEEGEEEAPETDGGDKQKQIIASKKLGDPDLPMLNITQDIASYHDPVFINDVRLSEFKQVLSRAGINSEFNSGILWCANGTVALRKQDAGSISIEGSLSEEYFQVRKLLYSQYAIV
ncbi:unnamed protein product, partial [Meganyctiphanes norvegica]